MKLQIVSLSLQITVFGETRVSWFLQIYVTDFANPVSSFLQIRDPSIEAPTSGINPAIAQAGCSKPLHLSLDQTLFTSLKEAAEDNEQAMSQTEKIYLY
ncbi:MAG TPA: hypothetical protein P5518_07055 [Candidatus Cloacimonas sp.]|nr:hypothetical protein [Candidatus Cloacimonas sp.]